VRFRNYSSDLISVPLQVWIYPGARKEPLGDLSRSGAGFITLSVEVPSGEVTQEFDPDDPIVKLMLKAHPELRPYVVKNAWEKVLAGIL